MTVPAWLEVQLAVGGALRLACGDRRGLGFFDVSVAGFWRSFRAAAICYPLYLLLVACRVGAAQWERSGVPAVVLVESIDYVISWVAFPLVVLPLARWFGRESRFLAFMVAYNWSQIPQIGLFAIVALDGATGLAAPSALQFAQLAAAAATLAYEWYIARVAMALSGAQAIVIVMADLVLSGILGRAAASMY